MPYALACFAVSLPVFVWAGSWAENSVWMAASFAIFALNWGAFYAAVNWMRQHPDLPVQQRLRIHVIGGLLWAGAVAQVAWLADGAGPAREPLLLMAAAGAIVCFFFSAPLLPALLIVAPAAAAGPLVALFSRPESRDQGLAVWGGMALAMALCLILNRMMRGQYALAAEREALIAERGDNLEKAQKLARSKSDIVSTLSHEIRNGLNGVTHVLAAAAGQGGRAAPSREQLAAALSAANELIAVLNATLDSETAESGRLALESQPFDPIRLTRELVLLNRPHASAKGVELAVHVEPELEMARGAVVGDATRARQVLSNLIGNAVKYTLRGRIEARIELREDGRLSIAVADTGPGLSAEELETAFEPFRRVERTGAGVPGAGLGLSLSRQLASLMGGDLKSQSAIGVGSCFTFELPWDPTAVAETEVEQSVMTSPVAASKRAMRVLVAEDDALNAAMLRAILEQLGHQVVHAQNGRRAVELASACDFDLVMLDGRMPLLDGAHTAAALRQIDGPCANVPIIAVIGGDAEEARECLDAGADTVLRKPVTVAGVARAVADAAARDRLVSVPPAALVG
ncbi:response regulator [Caulobacter sp. SLTY]|uniref:ATP-binding protein n=1 Tax=Caulobacter sp. SLTY TaxID=2683262 RepID=UPI001411D59E|nr:ATP-binding protein [Caulobacter sp. SLTY]NBB16242.1 response regulator [Caulobacter sp. SLTY]